VRLIGAELSDGIGPLGATRAEAEEGHDGLDRVANNDDAGTASAWGTPSTTGTTPASA
jgi:hypothetical protein